MPFQSVALAFSPNGSLLATGTYGGKIDLWDVSTGKRKRTLVEEEDVPRFPGTTFPQVSSVKFSPDGTQLAAVRGKTAIVWDVRNGEKKTVWSGRGDMVGVGFLNAGTMLAASSLKTILIGPISADRFSVSKAPPAPSTAEAQSLLDDIDKVDRQFGLAVIAATPPRVGGDPFSMRDTENRIQEIEHEIKFLDKGKPLGDEIMSAKASLAAYLKSPNDRDWSNAWRHLVTMFTGFVEFTSSALWREEVPLKESQEMTRHLELLKASMTRLSSR